MNFDLQDPAEMADAAADEGAAPDSPAAPEMSSIEAQIRCGEGRPRQPDNTPKWDARCKWAFNPVFEIAFQDVIEFDLQLTPNGLNTPTLLVDIGIQSPQTKVSDVSSVRIEF